jgi:hypothetical protein
MNDKELLFSEGFQKFSKSLGQIFYWQIHPMSELYKKKKVDLYAVIRHDWVIGYIIGSINFYYQLSSYNKFQDGYFYIIAGLLGSYKIIPAKDRMVEYKDFFESVEKKIDSQQGEMYDGYIKGQQDCKINAENKAVNREGRKISLQRYLLNYIKEDD